MTTHLVYVFMSASPPRWCVLRSAHPGGRIVTLCLDSTGYGRSCISTQEPRELLCPACRRELAAGTPGAALALDPSIRSDAPVAWAPCDAAWDEASAQETRVLAPAETVALQDLLSGPTRVVR